MTTPNSNEYNVQISNSKGPVIGNHAHVVQHFYDTSAEPPVDLKIAEETYRQKVVNAYGELNLSGFASADLSLANIPLEDIFMRLALTREKVIRESVSSEKSNQQRERVVIVQEPVELDQALSNHLLIVGEPGAGKSTLLRWLAVVFAQGLQREPDRLGPSADADRLPVLVELGRLPDDRYLKPEGGETPNWLQFLPEHITNQLAFATIPPQLLTQALKDGRCLLLFDGLDEVANRQARTRLASSLAELARLLSGNRVIIGSRSAGVSESEGALGSQFQRCQIKRFTPEDVQRFFNFWYALDHSLTTEQQQARADALYTRVQATPAILHLASTPLLCTILVLIWRNEGNLPERRVDLYERCCRILIEHWETSHDVAYQGLLAGVDWEEHLRLLTPLAYTIHSQEQRTSATREELIPLFAQILQTAGYYAEQAVAIRAAKQFLDILGLRSGLLQYIGDDRYGFPHSTFQEYLVARYIAAQDNYIDLVMEHLHELWWQEVHLLTIAHLGSGSKQGDDKAKVLLLRILHLYAPPSWILRSSKTRWLRLIEPGKLLPQVQLDRRLAWILAREFKLALKGYTECVFNEAAAEIDTALSTQAKSLVQHIISDEDRYEEQKTLITDMCQVLQHHGNEVVVKTLLEALHDANKVVREHAAESLGQVGAGNEVVVKALLEALHDANKVVQELVAVSLGQVGAGNEAVVKILLMMLRDKDRQMRQSAVDMLGKVGRGNEAAAVSALKEMLHDADWHMRGHVINALILARVVNHADLLETMYDEDRAMGMRRMAAGVLVRVGAGNEVAVSILLEALHDVDRDEREHAAIILGEVGAGNKAVVNALLEALHDEDPYVRGSAAVSLGKVGVGNEVVAISLLETLHDKELYYEDPEKWWSAAVSLGKVGVGNEVVAISLLETLHDENLLVRGLAINILSKVGVGNEAVVSALLEMLHDENLGLRVCAATILGKVGVGNEAVASALLEMLHDADWRMRGAAAESLGKVGVDNEAVVSTLLEKLHDADWHVRRFAAEGLGLVGGDNAMVVSALLEALRDTNKDVQWCVARSLGRLEIKDTTQLHLVLIALNRCLHELHGLSGSLDGLHGLSGSMRRAALRSIHQLLDGQPIPHY